MAAPRIAKFVGPRLVLPTSICANLQLYPQGCNCHNRDPNRDKNHGQHDIACACHSPVAQLLSSGLDPIRVTYHTIFDILGFGPEITELLQCSRLINNNFQTGVDLKCRQQLYQIFNIDWYVKLDTSIFFFAFNRLLRKHKFLDLKSRVFLQR